MIARIVRKALSSIFPHHPFHILFILNSCLTIRFARSNLCCLRNCLLYLCGSQLLAHTPHHLLEVLHCYHAITSVIKHLKRFNDISTTLFLGLNLRPHFVASGTVDKSVSPC